ncbi:MAG: FecR domain-containing protein [Tannerellaceae bacterium]|jgi:ferric-dicitrate binding protein FerR (iron transport regulator)|nr:FecR domain-containing protein [Tannerellaceae bacterium]
MEKELLYKYFANKTTSQEEHVILDWVDASAENYKRFLAERKIWNLTLLHSNEDAFGKEKGKTIGLWKAMAIAASIALLLSVSYSLYSIATRTKGTHSILVPPGQRTQLVLEDGTTVWLNARTKLTYPASFGKDSRNVTLNGEGYFEVNPDKDRPFIIHTEKFNIHVLGTTINVYAYDASPVPFELSLLAGKVRMEDKKGNMQLVALKPNEYVTEQNGRLEKRTIPSSDRFLWKDGLICLDDEPFDVLMEKFSEYHDISIIIKNDKYNKYRCTGKFRMRDGIDYALRVLQKDVKFNYERDDETHTILIY